VPKKKEIVCLGLLPSGRAVRVVKMNSKRMLDMIERVGSMAPMPRAGEKPPELDGKAMAKMSKATQRATIAMCVKGITLDPVTLVIKKRPPTEEERAAGTDAEVEYVDVDASLAPYKDTEAKEFKRWVPLGEQQLEDEANEDGLYMHDLFDDPAEWNAVLNRIKHAGGSSSIDPFVGKMLKTSAG